jgi:uncharacterized membrane protein YphA (DoxX/SURF4 family)
MESTIAGPRVTDEAGAGKVRNVVLWVLQIPAAAMIGMAGAMKLSGQPQMVAMFGTLGLGQWFRYVTGGLEVLGAVMLLVPRLAGAGALLLCCVMVGAIATHLFVIGGNPAIPIVLLLVLAVIAWFRRDRTLRLLGR